MATITCFEDMFSWQKARILNNIIYTKTKEFAFSKDFALRDQIRKSSISIMSNIAEGFERGSDSEFKYFLNVAKGSAGEVRSQLYIALDQGYIDEQLFNQCKDLVSDISGLLQGFIEYLQKEIERRNKSSK